MHKGESILNALLGVLGGLPSTGSNVRRARAWPIGSGLPALSIMMGRDLLDDELTSGVIKRVLNVDIVSHVRAIDNLETTLNQIKTEVFAAIMADITLGGTATYASLVGDDEPAIEAEQNEPTARMLMQWQFHYRHSATSTEV